jgi:putative tricarboxylic transport membrane protein
VLGLVLGSLFEKSLVQTSALSEGNFGVMVQSPAALGVLLFAVALIVVPPVIGNIRKRQAREAAKRDSGSQM